MEFPTGLLGVALGTVLLPSLARYHASNEGEAFSRLLDWGLRLTLLLALPAALALALLAVPLIATLFHYGAFSTHDLMMTREALMAYAIGLLGLIMVKVLAPGFYARQDIRTPVKIAIITLIATQALNAVLIVPLQHAGLALSIGLGACLNAAMLLAGLKRKGIYMPQPGWLVFVAKLAAALGAMGMILWFAMGSDAWWLQAGGAQRVAGLCALVVIGSGAYFATLWLLGFRAGDFSRRGSID
jgi:putative peptidoglycan lipid II flippase